MKNANIIAVCLLFCLAVFAPAAQSDAAMTTEVPSEVTLSSLPATIDDFLVLREAHGNNPAGTAALFVAAMIRYAEDQAAGLPMLVSILVNDNSLLVAAQAGRGYRGYDLSANTRYLIDRLPPAPWISRSYIVGTSPENGYSLPEGGLRLAFSTNRYSQVSADEVRIFVACSGADSPRPLRLRRNSAGLWKVVEFSSLVVGIRQPAAAASDDL